MRLQYLSRVILLGPFPFLLVAGSTVKQQANDCHERDEEADTGSLPPGGDEKEETAQQGGCGETGATHDIELLVVPIFADLFFIVYGSAHLLEEMLYLLLVGG